jgi:hypothetical protein
MPHGSALSQCDDHAWRAIYLGPGFPMIWRHDHSNASSRQGKSRTACLAKNHPVLNCTEALNLLLRSHRLAGEHPSWKRQEQCPSLIEPMALGAVMAMSRFPKQMLCPFSLLSR